MSLGTVSSWWIFPYLLGLFFGGTVVATMAHEGGRLLCARIGLIPIRRMVIGCGPALVRGYIRDARVEPLLETVAFADGASLADSLLNRIFLARAEHALGNAAAAGRLLAEARAIARSSFRGPVLTAWNGRIQREVRDMRPRRSRVRRQLGRRSLKAQGKLSLPDAESDYDRSVACDRERK